MSHFWNQLRYYSVVLLKGILILAVVAVMVIIFTVFASGCASTDYQIDPRGRPQTGIVREAKSIDLNVKYDNQGQPVEIQLLDRSRNKVYLIGPRGSNAFNAMMEYLGDDEWAELLPAR